MTDTASTAIATFRRPKRFAWRQTPAHAVRHLLAPAVGILLAIVLIQFGGFQGLPTIAVGLQYAVGTPEALARTVAWALPLLVATVGVVIAFRAGLFSVGAEGQIYVGALVGAVTGSALAGTLPVLHQALAIGSAAIVSGAVSAVFGWLAVRWKVDIVLSTLLGNYVLVSTCIFLAKNVFSDPEAEAPGATVPILPSAQLPVLLPRTQLTSAVFLVLVLCALVWWVMERAVTGYRWRMAGESPAFARAVGMNVARSQILACATSGALCGIAGALLVVAAQGRFTSEIAVGIGWVAIMLALMGRARVLPAIIWVLVYAVMHAASRKIEQIAHVPSDLAVLVICTVLITAAASPGLAALISDLWRRRRGMA
ncbi:ABC transporter permease [Microbacterium sp.]|uniref:ABC transporter permease n=1 Tax=Microbacterium sp. TaxID=51671 RepID=UPI0039E4F1C4